MDIYDDKLPYQECIAVLNMYLLKKTELQDMRNRTDKTERKNRWITEDLNILLAMILRTVKQKIGLDLKELIIN